ncbi:MAG: helix-hairpin-helix domain-containing protein [bacterium]
MFYFTKQEKIVILFLTGAIILGLGVQWVRTNGNLSVDSIKLEGKVNPVRKSRINSQKPEKLSDKKININSASIQELESLIGIGPKIAAKIINYREKHGEFKSIEDIKKVRGIGKKKFNKMKDNISVSDKITK